MELIKISYMQNTQQQTDIYLNQEIPLYTNELIQVYPIVASAPPASNSLNI